MDMKDRELVNSKLFLTSIFFNEITLYIYDIWIVIFLYQRGAVALSGFFISQLLPAVFMLFFGVAVDTYDRKRTLIMTKILRILLFMVLIINQNTITIYIVTFLLGFLSEVDSLACNVIMTQMVEKQHIVKLSSRANVLYSTSMIVGPIMASIVFLWDSNNIMVFILIACMILSVIPVPFMSIRNLIVSAEKRSSILLNSKEKFFAKSIFNNSNTIFVIIFWSLFMLCIGIAGPLEIVIISDILNMPSSYYSIGNTIEGIGTLLASVGIMAVVRKINPNKVTVIGMILSAIGYIIIGLSPNVFIYFVGALFIGMTAGICPFGFKTSLQVNTDNQQLGRTYSLARFVVLIARITGLFINGILVTILSARLIYLMAVIILLAGSSLLSMILKKDIIPSV